MFDPRVDLVSAKWSAFYKVTWSMPLLTELSDWRRRLDEIQHDIYISTNDTDVVFVADFPGSLVVFYAINNNNNNNNANICIARLKQNSSGALMAQTNTDKCTITTTSVILMESFGQIRARETS